MPKNNTVSTPTSVGDIQVHHYLVNVEQQEIVEQTSKTDYNETVKLQSLRDARLLYDGRVSGKHYEWQRAGSIQEVDVLDAPELLSKRIKTHSCCSGSDIAVFQLVD